MKNDILKLPHVTMRSLIKRKIYDVLESFKPCGLV